MEGFLFSVLCIFFVHQNSWSIPAHCRNAGKGKTIQLTSLSIEDPKGKVPNNINCFRYGIQRGTRNHPSLGT